MTGSVKGNRRRIQKVDDFFELDLYQLIVLLFNEVLIYTLLSNMVFNIFGASKAELIGCGLEEVYNGTKEERCAQLLLSNCSNPNIRYEFKSVVAEFGQYCPSMETTWLDTILNPLGIQNKAKFSTTSQMIGIILGSALAGQLSDLYGRKKITLSFLIMIFISCFSSAFMPSIDGYIIIRFFIGIAGGGLNTVSGIYIVEMLPAAHRIWLCTVITWAPNYILYALMAKVTGTWRLLAFGNSMVTLLAILVCTFILPESPKFLVQKRRQKEAIKALSYVNSFKRGIYKVEKEEIISVVQEACKIQEGEHSEVKKYHFKHLYSTRQLATRTIVCSIGMFALSYVTYGLIFNLDVIKGSIYLNTSFSGVLRWIVGAAVAMSDHFGKKFVGRRRLHFTTMSIIGVCMGLTFLIYVTENQQKMGTVVQCLTLFAFGVTGSLFLQILIVASELFPTGVRNLAVANINVCGRIGNVFGPMVMTLPKIVNGFPYLVMSLMCFADVILFSIFIPESKGVPLPNAMPEKRRKPKDLSAQEQLLVKA